MPPGYLDLIREGEMISVLLHGLMILAACGAAFLGYKRCSPWALLAVSLLPFCFGAGCYWLSMHRLLREQGGDIFREQIFGWIRESLPYFDVGMATSALTLIVSFGLYTFRRLREMPSLHSARG